MDHYKMRCDMVYCLFLSLLMLMSYFSDSFLVDGYCSSPKLLQMHIPLGVPSLIHEDP